MTADSDRHVTPDEDLRRLAVRRLHKQADFRTHLMVYIAVNAFLVGVWWWTGSPVFWPAFAMAGWGIGLAANAWDAYGREPIDEVRIRREIDRMRRR